MQHIELQQSQQKMGKPGRTEENAEVVKKIIRLKTQNPGITQQEIATITERNKSTVHRALKRYNVKPKRLVTYKDYRADILAGVQENILSTIDEDTVKDAKLKDRAIAFSILFDKERLERGQSTQNSAFAHIVEIVDKKSRQEENG